MEQSYVIRNDRVIGKAVPDINYNYSTCPIGSVFAFSSERIPLGFFICDGASYKVAEYPDLYAVIGNTYGGDSTNFNVPNLVDKFIQGSTTSGTEKEAGLPNITGELRKWSPLQTEGEATGVFQSGTAKNRCAQPATSGDYTSGITFDASKSNAIYGNSDTVQPPALTMVYIIKAFHTNEGVDSNEVTDQIIEYVEGEIAEVESKVASQISSAVAIKYTGTIQPNATYDTKFSLEQRENHFYGRLLQLDGHLGSKSSTFSFLLFVKANYDQPTTVYATQLAGMDDDRSNIAHTTYFELGVSSNGNLTITNKSAVTASYRFI